MTQSLSCISLISIPGVLSSNFGSRLIKYTDLADQYKRWEAYVTSMGARSIEVIRPFHSKATAGPVTFDWYVVCTETLDETPALETYDRGFWLSLIKGDSK